MKGLWITPLLLEADVYFFLMHADLKCEQHFLNSGAVAMSNLSGLLVSKEHIKKKSQLTEANYALLFICS